MFQPMYNPLPFPSHNLNDLEAGDRAARSSASRSPALLPGHHSTSNVELCTTINCRDWRSQIDQRRSASGWRTNHMPPPTIIWDTNHPVNPEDPLHHHEVTERDDHPHHQIGHHFCCHIGDGIRGRFRDINCHVGAMGLGSESVRDPTKK